MSNSKLATVTQISPNKNSPRHQLREEWLHQGRCLYHRGGKHRHRRYQVGQTEIRGRLDQS